MPARSIFAPSFLLVALLAAGSLTAQQPRQDRVVPRDDYFMALRGYYSGEYKQALKAFKQVHNGGIRSTEGRWVDSICYHTMAGECYYQMGEPAQALEQYEAALKLAVVHQDWLLRVQFPDALGLSNSVVRSRITWGATARRSLLGNYPDTMMSFQGQLNQENVVRTGGVVTPPQFYPLRVTEIIRCTGLALYRRWELMGPAGAHSPLTNQIVESFGKRSAPANHWSQAWIDAEMGLAQACAGKRAEAVAHLRKAVVAGGEYDHHLTPIVLLALGNLLLEDNRPEVAADYYLEASLAAAQFGQADVIEESLRRGLTTHIVRGGKGAYPQLMLAAPWAKRERLEALETSLLVMAVESFNTVGDTARASKILEETRRMLARSEMRAGNVGARFEYQNALLNFQQGSAPAAAKSLDLALAYQKKASHRVLHIALADQAYTGGSISARVAKDLYASVLHDPRAADWAIDPLDTMAVLLAPLNGVMENWMLAALERKAYDEALEISERIRRRRFCTARPWAEDCSALRWIMEAPKEALPEAAVLQRQDLLVKYPRYAELQKQSETLRAELAALPIAPPDAGELNKQKKLYDNWSKISSAQEAALSEIALRREPSELVFPPLRKTEEVQKSMPQRQLILSYFTTSRGTAAFLFSGDKYTAWEIEEPKKVATAAAAMLKEMGHFDANHALTAQQLQAEKWKEPAAELLKLLVKNAKPEFWNDYDELVVVPDGLLWYVPFEALQVETDAGLVPLISKVRIRYAPTIGLALPDGRGRKAKPNMAVVTGRLFPRDDTSAATDALAELRAGSSDVVGVPDPLPAPSSLTKTLWDRLVVLDDIDDKSLASFLWSPAQVDRGKPGSTLGDWFTLPFGAPDEVVLPGFHTAAETALKRGAAGDEIFITLCGLMSTGTRTVLISRWRTGGQSSFDLVREFVQESTRSSASQAWRRSVLLAQSADLEPQREPRVKLDPDAPMLKADHPFFWAGYLLADTGSAEKPDPAAKPVAAKPAVP